MKTLEKIDLFKLHKKDYAASAKPVLVDIKEATYLAIRGCGAPGGEIFQDRIGALYGVAFTLKMTRKFAGQQDYGIGKLEAQWWTESGPANFAQTPRAQWCWKLLIRTPDFIAAREVEDTAAALLKKGKSPSVREVRLESLAEGRCVQMLHRGPYDREHETVAFMQAHAASQGLMFHGRHHEIYLSDPRRVPPEKLKTILRLPVAVLP
jgi:hypothetical protein